LRVRFGSIAALVAVGCMFLGAASAAPRPQPVLHRSGGVISRGGSAAAHAALPGLNERNPIGPQVVDPDLQLTDHGGVVMKTENMYLVFWQPSGFTFPSGYEAAVEKWVNDVAADDGKTSNVFSAITQYGAGYNYHLSGSVLVHDAMPDYTRDDSGPCNNESPTTCVSEYDLITELDDTRIAQGWPAGGLSSQFAIILPPNLDTCDVTNACASNVFCAYHSYYTYTNSPTPYIFDTLPYEPAASPTGGCHTDDGVTAEPEPHGQVDVVIGSMSHEMKEAADDPTFHGWFDADGNESSDKCYIEYGSLIGSNNNQLINGEPYDVQTEWSNKLKGCYQVGPPTVGGFSPGTALAGQTVTITGTNFFAAYPGKPTVTFNGVASPSVTVVSPTQLTATVPAGNVSGKIAVTALAGSGTSSGSLLQAPTVTGLSATSGHAGDTVTISGTAIAKLVSVTFDGVAASFKAPAPDGSSVQVAVPAAATDGVVTLTTAAGSASSVSTFTVLPSIASFTPASGPAGTSLTISGSGFGALDSVEFTADGDANGIPVSHSATQIVVQVPANAKPGPFTVYTHSGADDVTSTGSFSPLPTISGFGSASYKPGDTATVNGANFTAGSVSVSMNGSVVCSSCSATATAVHFKVPNAVSGPVTVSNADGSVTSSAALLIVPRIDRMSGSGSRIVLSGAGFTGTSSVAFGGGTERAQFSVGSNGTTLQVTVPANATTGTISVTNAGGTTLSGFVFTVGPVVSAVAPASAAVGQTVGVEGSGLAGVDLVRFGGGVTASPASVSAGSVTVVVPVGAVTGTVQVHTAGGWVSAPRPLVVRAVLAITGVSPGAGAAGSSVVITGTGFTGATAVRFGSRPASFHVDSDTQITVVVPSGSGRAPVSVTVAGATAAGPPFTIT
jgi:IPT/TIG domain